jgi:hypothetical protein
MLSLPPILGKDAAIRHDGGTLASTSEHLPFFQRLAKPDAAWESRRMEPKDEEREPPRGETEEPHDGPGKWVAVVFVVALAALSIYVINTIIEQVKVQNCVLSGRHDCITIVPGDSTAH